MKKVIIVIMLALIIAVVLFGMKIVKNQEIVKEQGKNNEIIQESIQEENEQVDEKIENEVVEETLKKNNEIEIDSHSVNVNLPPQNTPFAEEQSEYSIIMHYLPDLDNKFQQEHAIAEILVAIKTALSKKNDAKAKEILELTGENLKYIQENNKVNYLVN